MTQDGYNPIREDMRLQNVVIDKDDVTMETDGRRKETGNINQDDDEFKWRWHKINKYVQDYTVWYMTKIINLLLSYFLLL